MAKVHYTVFRSGHYKAVKEAIDNASELNSINVSKRYYSDKVDQSENKTFSYYLLEQFIKAFGSDYYYRTEIVEIPNPVKSKVNAALQEDQDPLSGVHIRDFEHLFELNVDFVYKLYPKRIESFEDKSSLFQYLCTYPTIAYIFDYEKLSKEKGIELLNEMKHLDICSS